jgi:hypothetical protein
MTQLEKVDIGKAVPETDFDKNLEKAFIRNIDQLAEILNKGILLSENFNAYIATITTSAVVGTETAITHGLKRTPTGFIVLEKDKAAHIYLGASAKTATTYYVRSDVASVTAKLMIL